MMNLARLGLYEKALPKSLSLREKLSIASDCGFDFLEISVDETDEKLSRLELSEEELSELRRSMQGAGIRIETMCLSGHRKYPLGSIDEATRKRGMDILNGAVHFSAEVGIRVIQLAGYDVYYESSSNETRARFTESLFAAVGTAARFGVILAFETMETSFMDTVAKAMGYVELVNSPFLKVYPDTGNITNAAVNGSKTGVAANSEEEIRELVMSDLARGRGHIVALHLKESLPGKYREIPYGDGHVDFPACIGVAREMGVGLFLTEYWWDGKPDWKERAKGTNAFFRSLLNER